MGILVLVLHASPGAAQREAVPFRGALERIDEFVAREMERSGTPGLALAVTSRSGPVRVRTYGYADLGTLGPVTPETLFQIGSVSKAFTAIALLQLRDEGRFDVHRPVVEYLPWFAVQTRFEPITGHHLLTHTAGIPRDHDGDLPSLRSMLRGHRADHPPGATSSYSNVGFQVLGYLLEELTGEEYGEVIRKRIFGPLGMTASEPVITRDIRDRAATGHVRSGDDHGPPALVESAWFEYRLGDGSIAATPADLAAFLRMLLDRGGAPDGRMISDESFSLFTQRTVPAHHDQFSGYGIGVQDLDGHTILWHAGGMPGFTSMLMGDLDDALGVVVLANGPGDLHGVAAFALDALRAERGSAARLWCNVHGNRIRPRRGPCVTR